MKVRLTAGKMGGNGEVIPMGTVLDLGDDEALHLVELDVAEFVEETEEEATTEEPETVTPVDEGAGEDPSVPLAPVPQAPQTPLDPSQTPSEVADQQPQLTPDEQKIQDDALALQASEQNSVADSTETGN